MSTPSPYETHSASDLKRYAEEYRDSRITTLERELAESKAREGRKDSLLQECRGHLKGWKMSMLASTPERLLAKIEAELESKGNASESS